ncbi:tRNA pseudouridine(38-40) synthase TruA [Microbacterium sp. A94]|uniref:tRNA pseudouridine(38-40) synthase TruA n=1 Tax=Microbacterium sp. A94 TaxID=3450717 RepID=UPI003F4365C5
MRIRLDIAYDGTHFRGWAKQPGLRTVQGSLETALERIVGSPVHLVVAGRTDAGVHASGQVAHLDLTEPQWERLESRNGRSAHSPAESIARRVRGVLGSYPDVTVHRSSLAPTGFDARFSAVWRRYRYRLADDVTGFDPARRLDTTSIRGELDVETMDAAAQSLIGLHDFAAYCKPREGATTIRTLLDYRWQRDADGALVAEVKADAFCHSMVRALVGACAAVGSRRLDVSDLVALRDALERTSRFAVLAARGLTLTEVGYPSDDLLAVRAEQTRARRNFE